MPGKPLPSHSPTFPLRTRGAKPGLGALTICLLATGCAISRRTVVYAPDDARRELSGRFCEEELRIPYEADEEITARPG